MVKGVPTWHTEARMEAVFDSGGDGAVFLTKIARRPNQKQIGTA